MATGWERPGRHNFLTVKWEMPGCICRHKFATRDGWAANLRQTGNFSCRNSNRCYLPFVIYQ